MHTRLRTLLTGFALAFVVALVAREVPAAQAPGDAVRPAGTRSGCRTVPLSSTQVTVSPVATTQVASTFQYDPDNARFLTDAVMTDNRGTRVAMKTVSQYASTADVVHEVVRASGRGGASAKGSQAFSALAGSFESSDVGHGLLLSASFADPYRTVEKFVSSGSIVASGTAATDASSNIDWAVTTIPPLFLLKSVTITGGISSTTTYQFDSAGRIQRMVALASGSEVTLTYTAWDRFGRPTAGTQAGPGFRQTITIVMDDLARTKTTTYQTAVSGAANTTASVSKDTFDVNGNMILQEWQTPAGKSTTTVTLTGSRVICTGPK